MLLGYPSGGTIDRSATRFNQVMYGGLFFQDDWKVSCQADRQSGPALGIRGRADRTRQPQRARLRSRRDVEHYERGAGRVRRQPDSPGAAVRLPRPRRSDVRERQRTRDQNPDLNNFQPRAGFAYQLDSKTVVRGGWAIYAVPALFDISGIYQPGFSQGTSIVPSLDTGVTIRATLANPFPDGVADPPGASLGPNTFVGRAIGRFNNDLDYRNGQSMRWSIGMQRELPGQWVVEGAYVASRSYDLTTDFNANPVPRQYLSTSSVRDQTTINFLTANVANPFARPAAGRDAQRRDHTASATAAAVPAVPEHRHSPLRRVEQLRLGAVPGDQALHGRLHGRRGLHVVRLQGARHAPERHRSRLRRALQRHPPPAPPRRQRHLGAALRQRPPVGQ